MTNWLMTVLAEEFDPYFDPIWLKTLKFLWNHPLVTLAGLTLFFWIPTLNIILGDMGPMSDGAKIRRIEDAIAGRESPYTWKSTRITRRIAIVLTIIWGIAFYLCLKFR